jgi:putative ABC transport system permease protein
MFRLVLRAMSARRAQGFAVLVLCALAVGSAAAAPWYVLTATNTATRNEIAQAAPAERIVSVATDAEGNGDAQATMNTFNATVTSMYAIPFGTPIHGLSALMSAQNGGSIELAYRDDVCAHVAVVGACPTSLNQVMITATTAAQMNVQPGDTITVGSKAGSLALTVTGIYHRVDPNGQYWTSLLFSGTGADVAASGAKFLVTPDQGLFATVATLSQKQISTLSVSTDLPVLGSLLGTAALESRLDAGAAQVKLSTMTVYTEATALSKAVAGDRRSIQLGVAAALLELLLLCWFALFLAARYTARDRRADIGLLKLRGSGRVTLMRLSLGQSLVPMVGGLIVGIAAAGIAGIFVPALADRTPPALVTSGIAAFTALFGVLLAIGVAEWRTGRSGVNDLLRRVPARRRGVRADIGDLVVVMLAAAAVFQSRVDSSASGLVTVAPALVALAVALVAARILVAIGTAVGAAAMRAGRVRTAVGLLQVARRPGIDRVFVLLTVSVALLATSGAALRNSIDVRAERANIDVGAARVLTVHGTTPLNLLSVVRNADPDGRNAMAAVVYPVADPVVNGSADARLTEPVIAVDASRLAAVTVWPAADTAMTPAQVATALRPKLPPSIEFTSDSLTVDVTATQTAKKASPYLLISGMDEITGDVFKIGFGPLVNGRQTMTRPVPACGTDRCRIYAIEITGAPTPYGAWDWNSNTNSYEYMGIPGTGIVFHQLSGSAGVVADGAVLGDVTRWRTLSDTGGMGLGVSYADGQLAMNVTNERPPPGEGRDGSIFTTDGPIPLPGIRAGAPTAADGQLELINSATIPIRYVGKLPSLPGIGGSGLMVDLTALQHSVIDARQHEVFQVWLSPSAPASVISKLEAGGLAIAGDTTIVGYRARLAQQGPSAALRFQVVAGTVGLLLAAGALVVVAAAERKPRAAELLALRVQGLSRAAANAIGYGGYAILILLAIGGGILAAVLARLLSANRTPLFVDSWSLIPPGSGLATLPIVLVAGAALLIFGGTGLVAGRSLSTRSNGQVAA